MDFDFTDEQREIKSTAREFLASRFKPERVRELAESDSPYGDEWEAICELGWPGIAIAEEYGGEGLGAVELIILQEELGYALAPTPVHRQRLRRRRDPGRGLRRAEAEVAPGHRLGQGARLGRDDLRPRPDPRRGGRRLDPGPGRRRRREARRARRRDARAARLHRHDPRLLPRHGRGRRSAAGRHRERRKRRPDRAGGRVRGRRAARARHVGRVREGAPAVRPPDRRLPGRLAPPGRHALGGRGGPLAHLLGGLGRRRRPGPLADRRLDGQGARVGRRDLGHAQRDSDPRRHRLHLGARRPLPA